MNPLFSSGEGDRALWPVTNSAWLERARLSAHLPDRWSCCSCTNREDIHSWPRCGFGLFPSLLSEHNLSSCGVGAEVPEVRCRAVLRPPPDLSACRAADSNRLLLLATTSQMYLDKRERQKKICSRIECEGMLTLNLSIGFPFRNQSD